MIEHLVASSNTSGVLGGGHSVYVFNVTAGDVAVDTPVTPAVGQQLTINLISAM